MWTPIHSVCKISWDSRRLEAATWELCEAMHEPSCNTDHHFGLGMHAMLVGLEANTAHRPPHDAIICAGELVTLLYYSAWTPVRYCNEFILQSLCCMDDSS
jgi:hypothetical protein